MNHISAAGMAWYKPENFLRLRAMFEDGHKLHETYGEWLAAAQTGKQRLESQGIRVFCVDIDPDQFPEWCKAEGLKLNADARNRYASWVAHRISTGDG
jgi:hypothetical protein